MLKRVHFGPSLLPFLLVAPQIIITLVFFIWPASQALYPVFPDRGRLRAEHRIRLVRELSGTARRRALSGQFDPQDRGLLILRRGAVAVLRAGPGRDGRPGHQGSDHLPHLADLALRGGAGDLPGALWVFMFDPTLGIFHLHARRIGVRVEPQAQWHRGDGACDHRRGLEAGQPITSCSSSPRCSRSPSR